MDHERVAALHDGKLGAHERDELLAAIAADDDESWLFAETAGVLADLEAAHAPAPPATFTADPAPSSVQADDERDESVIPIATRRPPESPGDAAEAGVAAHDDGVIPIESRRRAPARRWQVYGAVAAALVGIAVTGVLLNRSANARLDDPVEAVAMLEKGATPGVAQGWDKSFDNHLRGGNHSPGFRRTSVRLGAQLVDLELAAAAQDTTLRRLSSTVIEVLSDSSMHGAAYAAGIYRQVEQKAAAGDFDVQPLLADGRKEVQSLTDSDWLELGIWAEAARTAAARRDARFFASRTTRRVLDRAATLPDAEQKTLEALAAVRNALPAEGRATDWPGLKEKLGLLLNAAGS